MENVGICAGARPPVGLIGLVHLLTLLGVGLRAQYVVPRALATTEGGSSTAIPFGTDQPGRVQCIYDAEELPWTGALMIQGIDLRADNSVPGTTQFALKQFVAVDVWVSTAATTSENPSQTYAANHGLDVTRVLANGRLSLPAQPPSNVAPRPCNVPIPFSLAPFFYDLSPIRGPRPRRPGLCIEMAIQVQPTGDYRMDSNLVCTSPWATFGVVGPACLTSRRQTAGGYAPLGLQPFGIGQAVPSISAGGRVTYAVTNMPDAAPFVLALGSLEATGSWQGQPLPAPLFSTCYVNTDWLTMTPGLGDTAGVGQISFSVPIGRQLVGRWILAQAICRDLAANPAFMVTSLGVKAQVCGPLGVARVSNLGDSQATSGSVSVGSALVFQTR